MMVLLTVLMVAELAAPAADATARSDTYETVGSNNERQGHFAECGCSMLAAAEAQPDSPRHAERLWKAGQCFENAHLTNRATASWLAEIQAHPKDPFARKATARLARRYRDLCYDCDSDSPYPQTPSLPDESREFKEARDAAMFRDIGLSLLAGELIALQQRGYTIEEVAESVRGRGLAITTPTLKNYLQRAKSKTEKRAKNGARTASGGSVSGAPKAAKREAPNVPTPTQTQTPPAAKQATSTPEAGAAPEATALRSGKGAFLVQDKKSY
jgi:hypothetical protein